MQKTFLMIIQDLNNNILEIFNNFLDFKSIYFFNLKLRHKNNIYYFIDDIYKKQKYFYDMIILTLH